MEDDKKKKRNKKKKNKQNKTTEEVAVGADQNPVTTGHNDDIGGQAFEKADIQNGQVDLDRHQTNGTESPILDEAERQHLLQKEATLKQTIKQLQNERESRTRMEATLEEKIKQLQNESDSHKEKVSTFEETIKYLQKENDLHMQKEATLEETIKQLRSENDSLIQKEVGLDMNIAKLQSEKDAWLKKESELEEKISQLMDETSSLNVKRTSLEEKIKLLEAERDSWIRMESISRDTIASLNIDVTRLRMQVTDMEESRNNLIQENHQLKEDMSSLQLQTSSEVKKRTSEQEDFNTQMEAACALVDKLITENVELVEKVNELSVKLDNQIVASPPSSSIKKDPMITTISDALPMSESSENIPTLNQLECSREVAAIKEERNGVNHMHAEPAAVVINSSEPDNSGEIVQIPLDDNEVRDVESQQQVVEDNGEAGVPLTDAPLIGAPFRFVSFVAKYVSGADLVSNNSSNLGS
ncbi:kinesin-1-like isoform X2 [Melia azedarach]|uniref:Kinesin-1-like isoform X2 n=1 Tax=Melia azedarach TaxID=155640 RepID=A0ACC1WYI1_MELAZ|nr:kinesin-1-like isoform X2 [Melia azedarach]